MTRTSGLYVGTVGHRRHRPAVNAFTYRAYHALLDLDELATLDADVGGFGYGRPAVAAFRDRDHFAPDSRPVRTKLAEVLEASGRTLPGGHVWVLANLRVVGQVFDPVSWWFCHHPDGTLGLVVAEVHNTFGEAFSYVLDDLEEDRHGWVRARAVKRFHVSPFLPVDGLTYAFAFRLDADRIAARVVVSDAEGPVLDAWQVGARRELTTRSLAHVLVTHPLMPLRTVLLIHLQAIRLLARRVKFHRKPALPAGGTSRRRAWRDRARLRRRSRRSAVSNNHRHPEATLSPDSSSAPDSWSNAS